MLSFNASSQLKGTCESLEQCLQLVSIPNNIVRLKERKTKKNNTLLSDRFFLHSGFLQRNSLSSSMGPHISA